LEADPKTVLPPFQRVYFDSDSLFGAGWPHIPAKLRELFEVSRALGVDIFVPEPTLVELENRWRQKLEDQRAVAQQGLKEFHHTIEMVPEIDRSEPASLSLNADVALSAYRERVRVVCEEWQLTRARFTTRSVQEVFEAAASHTPPFGKDVQGFKDTIIFLSVLDHAIDERIPSALVSGDRAFSRFRDASRTYSASLITVYAKIQDASDRLHEVLKKTIKQKWDLQKEFLRVQLMDMRQQIENFLLKNLTFPASWSGTFFSKPVEMLRVKVNASRIT